MRGLGWTGLLVIGLTAVLLLVGWRAWLFRSQRGVLFRRVEDVPARRVAIVLGAGIYLNAPTAVLADRIETAVALYKAGKVHKLLMTGDNSHVDYNEPGVMKAYAEKLGIPAEDIVLDYAGFRTYDSCYRARAIFGLTDALVVSQPFHLARATYLCGHLGVNAVGFEARGRRYSRFTRAQWELRELLACAGAWWDIHVGRPLPILGKPLPIRD